MNKKTKQKTPPRSVHMLPIKDSLQIETQPESGGMEIVISCKWKQTKAGVAISDKTDFKTRAVTRDKDTA